MTGLLIAALTASTHANRRGRGSEVLLSLPCDRAANRAAVGEPDAAAMPTGVGLASMQLPAVAT